MRNLSFFPDRVAIRVLFLSWLLTGVLFFLSLHAAIGDWLYCAFFVGHGVLLAIVRGLNSPDHLAHLLSRDYLIAVCAPWIGPLVWYYRCKHSMGSLQSLSCRRGFGLPLLLLLILVLVLGVIPLLWWIFK